MKPSVRKMIERELARVNGEIEALKKEPRAEELEGFGDNTPLSEEADASLVGEDRELRSDHLGRLLDRAAALDEALHRVNAGTYGMCVSCGAPISRERLEVLPEALRCTRCQELEEEKPPHHEMHAHEWKRTEDTYRERREREEGEPDTSRPPDPSSLARSRD